MARLGIPQWMQRLVWRVCVLLGGLLTVTFAGAQPLPLSPQISWRQLSPEQRSALAPLANEWSRMPADAQRRWIAVSGNYRQLSPSERERLQARMGDWARMSKSERMQARLNYGNARQSLSADERRARWDAYRNLDADARAALARQAEPAIRARRSAAPALPPPRHREAPRPSPRLPR